jgi:hypothetical protein
MKNHLAEFRDTVSFIAGILIGLSIMVLLFAGMAVELTGWQMLLLLFVAPVILTVGVTLQVIITSKAPHGRVTSIARSSLAGALR